MEKQEALQVSKNHMFRYVLVKTVDKMEIDGFVEHVDDNNLYLAEPMCEESHMDMRQPAVIPGFGGPGFGPGYGPPGYGPPGYGYPGYGFGYPGYGYPYYPRRRFRRRIFPLAGLLGLSLLPFY